MKINRIVFFTFTMLSTVAFSAERPPQPPKKGALEVLPAELRLEQAKMLVSRPTVFFSDQAVENLKRYYLAHPPSQQNVNFTKAVLAQLIAEQGITAWDFENNVINKLRKLPTMTALQDPELKQWIEQQKNRLKKEEALRHAASEHNVNALRNLISQGVNTRAKTGVGGTALMLAVMGPTRVYPNDLQQVQERNDTVTELLNAGAYSKTDEFNPLIPAILNRLTSTTQLLLDAGVDPNKPSEDKYHNLSRNTPLAQAAMELLTELTKTRHYGNRPGFTSYVPQLREIITLLLNAGANPNTSGMQSFTNVKDLIHSNFAEQYVRSQKYFIPAPTEEEKAEVIATIYGAQK